MLTLTTLGGLALAADGRELGSVAAQRRPLALLAVLAAAGQAAVSRERLAGLLWPDSQPERARRSVAQALYTLRRAADVESVVVGTTELRLNHDVVVSDVAAFREALAAGRLDDAVGAYRGPFLEGFHVPGAVDFERWMEAERERIAHDCARALTLLARRAESAGDLAEAASVRRRLVALDPLDSAATLALMDVLARVGDVAGALRTARTHETLLAEQLELPLPATIQARVAALLASAAAGRASAPARSLASREEHAGHAAVDRAASPVIDRQPEATALALLDASGDDVALLGLAEARAGIRPAPRGESGAMPPRPGRRDRPTWRAGLTGLAVVASLVAGGLLGRRGTSAPAAPAPVLRANVFAVLPFATDSVDASLGYLGEGVANALARMLSGGTGPRAVDPATVLSVVERQAAAARAAGDVEDTRDRARRIGHAVGASDVVLGRVTGTARRLTLTATLLDVASGVQRTMASATGPVDSLAVLLDGLAARVASVRDLGGERAGAFGPVSLPVLRAYLDAEAALRDDRVEDAVRLYERALDGDSAFVPAALGLAEAADRYNAAEQHDRGLALAWAGRGRLGEGDRAWLTALAGPRYPAPSPAAEQLAAWERAVVLAPDRAAAWNELGERLLRDGRVLGLRQTAEDRAAAAFRRALELDPDFSPSLRNQVELAALQGDTATLRRIASPERIRAFGGDLTGYLLWRVATVRGDAAALVALRDRLPSLGAPSLRAIAVAAQHTGLGRDDGERALRHLAGRAALAAEQLDVLLAQHSLSLNQGRPVLALDVTEQLQDAQPGSRAHLRLRVLDALYARGDTAAAGAAALVLAQVADAPPQRPPESRALQLADACVLAQWRVAGLRGPRSDPATVARVRSTIATLRGAALPRRVVPVAVTPPACAELLDAMLAVAVHAPDARRRVEALDALMLTGPAIGDARHYAQIVVARLHRQLGEAQRALLAIRQRSHLRGWPRYLATSWWEEAQLALAVGDREGARRAARRLLELRAGPEASLGGEVDSARAMLAPDAR